MAEVYPPNSLRVRPIRGFHEPSFPETTSEDTLKDLEGSSKPKAPQVSIDEGQGKSDDNSNRYEEVLPNTPRIPRGFGFTPGSSIFRGEVTQDVQTTDTTVRVKLPDGGGSVVDAEYLFPASASQAGDITPLPLTGDEVTVLRTRDDKWYLITPGSSISSVGSTPLYIAEIDSAATGGGYYNCHLQSLDSTDWNTSNSDQLDPVGNSIVVLNIAEIGTSNHGLSAGDAMLCWSFTDDEGVNRYLGEQTATYRIRFGKPTAAYSSGSSLTLDPCDIAGNDTGEANVTVNMLVGPGDTPMTNSTSIADTTICPFYRASDGSYYLLGTPIEVVTDYRVNTTNKTLEKMTRNVWVLTAGSESSWVVVHTGVDCT